MRLGQLKLSSWILLLAALDAAHSWTGPGVWQWASGRLQARRSLKGSHTLHAFPGQPGNQAPQDFSYLQDWSAPAPGPAASNPGSYLDQLSGPVPQQATQVPLQAETRPFREASGVTNLGDDTLFVQSELATNGFPPQFHKNNNHNNNNGRVRDNNLYQEIDHLKDTVSQLSTSLNALTSKVSESASQNTSWEATLGHRIEDFLKKPNGIVKTFEASMTELRTKQAEQGKFLKNIFEGNRHRDGQVTNLRQDLSQLQQQMARQASPEARIAAIEAKLQAQLQQVSLDPRFAAMEAQLREQQRQLQLAIANRSERGLQELEAQLQQAPPAPKTIVTPPNVSARASPIVPPPPVQQETKSSPFQSPPQPSASSSPFQTSPPPPAKPAPVEAAPAPVTKRTWNNPFGIPPDAQKEENSVKSWLPWGQQPKGNKAATLSKGPPPAPFPGTIPERNSPINDSQSSNFGAPPAPAVAAAVNPQGTVDQPAVNVGSNVGTPASMNFGAPPAPSTTTPQGTVDKEPVNVASNIGTPASMNFGAPPVPATTSPQGTMDKQGVAPPANGQPFVASPAKPDLAGQPSFGFKTHSISSKPTVTPDQSRFDPARSNPDAVQRPLYEAKKSPRQPVARSDQDRFDPKNSNPDLVTRPLYEAKKPFNPYLSSDQSRFEPHNSNPDLVKRPLYEGKKPSEMRATADQDRFNPEGSNPDAVKRPLIEPKKPAQVSNGGVSPDQSLWDPQKSNPDVVKRPLYGSPRTSSTSSDQSMWDPRRLDPDSVRRTLSLRKNGASNGASSDQSRWDLKRETIYEAGEQRNGNSAYGNTPPAGYSPGANRHLSDQSQWNSESLNPDSVSSLRGPNGGQYIPRQEPRSQTSVSADQGKWDNLAPVNRDFRDPELDRNNYLMSAYLGWCKEYGREPSDDRFRQFSINYSTMEEMTKDSKQPLALNEYADFTTEEFELANKGVTL